MLFVNVMLFISCACFFYKQPFYKKCQAAIGKKSSKWLDANPETELWLFGNYSHSSSNSTSKNNGTYSKKLYDSTMNIIKTKIKMKIRSHRYDINLDLGLDMDKNLVNIKSV